MGGTIAVVAGAALRPQPAGVADLSGEANLNGFLSATSVLDAVAAAPRLRAPTLFAVARGDRFAPVADMRTVYLRAGSARRVLILEPAHFGHGWEMVAHRSLARRVLAFVRSAGTGEHG